MVAEILESRAGYVRLLDQTRAQVREKSAAHDLTRDLTRASIGDWENMADAGQ